MKFEQFQFKLEIRKKLLIYHLIEMTRMIHNDKSEKFPNNKYCLNTQKILSLAKIILKKREFKISSFLI